jgi:hypothetical protein
MNQRVTISLPTEFGENTPVEFEILKMIKVAVDGYWVDAYLLYRDQSLFYAQYSNESWKLSERGDLRGISQLLEEKCYVGTTVEVDNMVIPVVEGDLPY